MNKNERVTYEKYKESGMTLSRNGWPDFWRFKDGRLTTVETKTPTDDLSFEQRAIRDFLIPHGVRYIVEVVENGESKTAYDSDIHANRKVTDTNQSTPAQTTLPQTRPAHSRDEPTQANPNQPTPAQFMPRQTTPARTNPCQTRPAHPSPRQSTPVHTTTIQAKPYQTRPNHPSTGHANPYQTTRAELRRMSDDTMLYYNTFMVMKNGL